MSGRAVGSANAAAVTIQQENRDNNIQFIITLPINPNNLINPNSNMSEEAKQTVSLITIYNLYT